MIKAALKETVIDLAIAGLARCTLSYIEKNPHQRMHLISENVFGLLDHKQMLASVVVKHLVDDGRVIKYQPVKSDKYGQILYGDDQRPLRYKHFVYVSQGTIK